MQGARRVAVEAMQHALLHFQQMAHALLTRLTRDASRSPIFQTILAWEPDGGWAAALADDSFGESLSARALDVGRATAKVELSLVAHKSIT
eukprot:5730088-Prymnesium_polylepis.1